LLSPFFIKHYTKMYLEEWRYSSTHY